MATPHYVAKRVGDQFVIVPANGSTWVTRAGPGLLLGGSALAALALRSRGPARWGVLGLAASLACLWYILGRGAPVSRRSGHRLSTAVGHGPSFARDQSTASARSARTNPSPHDAVDEASMESFPASDPPSHMTPTRST